MSELDIHTVTSYRHAQDRADLILAPGERIVAGGTWFFSEPQPDVTGVVDISDIGWPDYEDLPDGGLRVSAVATIESLAALPPHPDRPAQALFGPCARALLASFKVLHVATVGGNICRSFTAASMVSLMTTLDGVAHIWSPDGTDRDVPIVDLITGQGTNSLAPGEVLRAVDVPAHALRSTTAFRKIALSELGRSGAVITGRRDVDGGFVVVITTATLRPRVLRYPGIPDPAEMRAAIEKLPDYYTDPLGSADWRRGVSGVLAEEIRQELAA